MNVTPNNAVQQDQNVSLSDLQLTMQLNSALKNTAKWDIKLLHPKMQTLYFSMIQPSVTSSTLHLIKPMNNAPSDYLLISLEAPTPFPLLITTIITHYPYTAPNIAHPSWPVALHIFLQKKCQVYSHPLLEFFISTKNFFP